MVEVMPVWMKLMTAWQAEEELTSFRFHGTGLYITSSDTLLVVPVDTDVLWSASYPAEQLFHFYYWECPLEKTIFGINGSIPTRRDAR